MSRDEVARKYLGVPFRHQGRNPAIGIDCIGFVVCWGADLGLPFVLADRTDYGRDPAHGLLEQIMGAAIGPMLPTAQMQAGDIAAIAFKGAVRHVGVVVQGEHGLNLIHTNGAVGRVTEARIDDKWRKRIVGAWRP